MKSLLVALFLVLVIGLLGYAVGIMPSVVQSVEQGHVETGYQWLAREWSKEKKLMITEPISASEYLNLTERQRHEIWKEHPYHSVATILDLLSASPIATGCCDAPVAGETVRYLSPAPNDEKVIKLIVRRNGDVIISKATINVPSFSW